MPFGELAVWYGRKAWKGICAMQNAKSKKRNTVLGTLIALILVISTIGIFNTFPRSVNAASLNGSNVAKIAALGGTGATLPYVEMAAHNATTNGTVLGPDFTLGDLAADAVDRQAVLLTQAKSVEFTLPQAANSINLRYSIPDSASGGGFNASLSIYINGTKQTSDLQL